MADLIDPDKLVSIGQVAGEYGYHPSYLSRRAAEGKLKAWHVGNSWITTRENISAYIATTPPKGRPTKKIQKNT